MRINVYQVTFHTITYADKNQNGVPVEVSRTEPVTEKVAGRTQAEAFALIPEPTGEGVQLVHLSTRTLQQNILAADYYDPTGAPLPDAPTEEPVEQTAAEEEALIEEEGGHKKEGIWERLTS
jgi:hypothetical protein